MGAVVKVDKMQLRRKNKMLGCDDEKVEEMFQGPIIIYSNMWSSNGFRRLGTNCERVWLQLCLRFRQEGIWGRAIPSEEERLSQGPCNPSFGRIHSCLGHPAGSPTQETGS